MHALYREDGISLGFALYNGILIPLKNFNQLNLVGVTSLSGARSTASKGVEKAFGRSSSWII